MSVETRTGKKGVEKMKLNGDEMPIEVKPNGACERVRVSHRRLARGFADAQSRRKGATEVR